jgi:hypothetical protein
VACRFLGEAVGEELLEVAEHYADGSARLDDVWAVYFATREHRGNGGTAFHLIRAAVLPPADTAARALANPVPRPGTKFRRDPQDWTRSQCDMLRCLWSHCLHPMRVDPAWLVTQEGLIRRLAQGCYDSRDFAALPALGDALEEAGCCDSVVLAHCRGPGEHYRGCFVLDAILGKQ